MRFWAVVLTSTALTIVPAQADIVAIGLPAEYTPGTAFNVDVSLAPVSSLGLFNIEVVFRTASPQEGLLFVDPPTAALSGYVFTSSMNFFGSAVPSGTDYRVVLSDFTLGPAGIDILPESNDRVATLTVRPSNSLTGPISVFVEPTSLQIDDLAGSSLLGPGIPAGGEVPHAVPAPAGVACAAVGLLVLGLRRWRAALTVKR